MPKMVHCRGSGQRVDGPDKPTGTVQCRVCGNSALYMQRAVDGVGKEQLSVPDHHRVVYPAKRAKGSTSGRARLGRRDSGRR